MIIHGDCLEVMSAMDSDSIDLTVTSPPYDNLRDYNGYMFDWFKTLKELYRVTKEGGVVVWVVGDATIKGSETGTSFKQALGAMAIGFNLHDTMIYQKRNYVPLTHNRYEQSFEYMFVLSKGKPRTFNAIRVSTEMEGKSISRRNTARVGEAATRNREETTVIKATKQKPNIWCYIIGRRTDNGNHPATFPEQLAHDHIISWSNKGDTVLDPMCGSGTTLKMAKKLGRDYIGIDVSEEYIKIAEARIKAVQKPML